MIQRISIFRGNEFFKSLNRRFSLSKPKKDDDSKDFSETKFQKIPTDNSEFIGRKQYNIDSFLLTNKLLDESITDGLSNPLKYLEKENRFFLRHATNSVEFFNPPQNDKLFKRHEFYQNRSLQAHRGHDIKKFEQLLRDEVEKSKQVESVPVEPVANKQRPVKIKKNKKIIENRSEKTKHPEHASSSNEFVMTEEIQTILNSNKQSKKNDHKPDRELTGQDSERLKFRKLLLQEDKDDRDKKVKRHSKFISKFELNENFLVDKLLSVPFLSKEMILAHREFYTEEEIKTSGLSLFKKADGILKDFNMPSVSNIIQLSNPLSEDILKWQLEKVMSLGLDGFKEYWKKLKTDGHKFHSYIGKKLKKEPVEPFDENLLKLENIFQDVGEVLLTESPVTHSNLCYQGRIDCLAYYKGNLCLIDWKTSEKSKPEIKDMFEYPAQISAYIGAFLNDPRYEELRQKHQIKSGMLVNYNKTNGEIDVHLINYQLAEFYWYKWLNFLRDFWGVIEKNRLNKI